MASQQPLWLEVEAWSKDQLNEIYGLFPPADDTLPPSKNIIEMTHKNLIKKVYLKNRSIFKRVGNRLSREMRPWMPRRTCKIILHLTAYGLSTAPRQV